MNVRIAVVGGGTMGAQVLNQLADRGVDVVGYELFTPGHTRGSAGGDSRLFTSLDVADEDYEEVIRRARTLWLELNEATGQPLLQTSDALIVDSNDGPAAKRDRLNPSARLQQVDSEYAAKHYPQLITSDSDALFVDHLAGALKPEMANHSIFRLAESKGAMVKTQARVREVSEAGAGVDIVTEDGTRESFDFAVVTAGAWSSQLVPELASRIAVRRLTSSWFFPAAGYSFEKLTPFMRLHPEYIYGIPSVDRSSVKLGVGFEHHRPVADPDTQDRSVASRDLSHILSLVQMHLPGLESQPYRSDTYFETYTASRRELLDWSSQRQRIFVAAGFSGHGFKVAPAIGEYIADRVLDTPPKIRFDKFERFGSQPKP